MENGSSYKSELGEIVLESMVRECYEQNFARIPDKFLASTNDKKFIMAFINYGVEFNQPYDQKVLNFIETMYSLFKNDWPVDFNLKNDKDIICSLSNKIFSISNTRVDKLNKLVEEITNTVNSNENLKNDKEVIKAIVKNDYLILKDANSEIKNDKDIISIAIDSHEYVGDGQHYPIYYAGDELKNNKEFAMDTLKKHGNLFGYFENDIKSDKDCMSVALTQLLDTYEEKQIKDMSNMSIDDILSLYSVNEILTAYLNKYVQPFLSSDSKKEEKEQVIKKYTNDVREVVSAWKNNHKEVSNTNPIADSFSYNYNKGYTDAVEGRKKIEYSSGGMDKYAYDRGFDQGMTDKFMNSNKSNTSYVTFEPIEEKNITNDRGAFTITEEKPIVEEKVINNVSKEKLFEEGKKAALENYDVNDFIEGFEEGLRMKAIIHENQSRITDDKTLHYHSSGVSDGHGGMIALEQFEEYGIDPSLPNARELLEEAVQMGMGHSHNL